MLKIIDKSLLSIGEGKTRLSLFSLAIPIFFENIGVHLISMIQSALAARYAEGFFVTPMNIASNTAALITSVASMISTGMSILLSIYLGKKDDASSRELVGTSLIALVLLRFAVFGVAFVFARPIMAYQGLLTEENSQMLPHAIAYFRGLCVINVFSAISVVLSGALRCYGAARVGFWASIVSGLVTLVLTYVVFYVFETERSLAIGRFIAIGGVAALSAIVINVVGFVLKKIPISFKPNGLLLKKIVAIGFPATVSVVMYSLSNVIAGAICVNLSNDMFQAKTFVTSVVYFTYVFGFSIGQANSLMVGMGCGMGEFDRVDRLFRQNLKITLFTNFVFSLVVAVLGKYLLRIFTDSPSIIAIGSVVFFIDIAVELGRGMNHLGQYGLNATGDTVYTTVVSVVSCWACSVGVGYLLGVVAGLGIYGLWIASAVDELFRGTLYLVRWKKGDWHKSFIKEERTISRSV